jgi:hypothetical protein
VGVVYRLYRKSLSFEKLRRKKALGRCSSDCGRDVHVADMCVALELEFAPIFTSLVLSVENVYLGTVRRRQMFRDYPAEGTVCMYVALVGT